MDPRASPSSLYTSLPCLHPSAASDRLLSEVACRAVIEQVKNTVTQGHAILSFLQSTDPGAHMDDSLRDELVARCISIAHNGYLEDVWPGVHGSSLNVPANAPLPVLRESHQHEAQQRAQSMDTLAQVVVDLSRENLNQHLAPLKAQLALTQDKVNALMTDCHPQICEIAQGLIACIEQPSHRGTLDGCFIAKRVRDLESKKDMLVPTLLALDALIAIRTEERMPTSVPLAARSPAFHEEWKRAVKDMENAFWPSLKRRLDTLIAMRAAVLRPDPATPSR